RSSMQAEKLETVPFEQELKIVMDYLALEHIRFEERLRIGYNIRHETLTLPVPPMMLQTLVENAIKHGIARRVEGGLIQVHSELDDGYHRLTVQNSGLLNGRTGKEGFGLSATRTRLHLLFGEQARFEIAQKGDLVVAEVRIPVKS